MLRQSASHACQGSLGLLLPSVLQHTDQYYAAVVMAGQKRPDGQWYLLHYEGGWVGGMYGSERVGAKGRKRCCN